MWEQILFFIEKNFKPTKNNTFSKFLKNILIFINHSLFFQEKYLLVELFRFKI